MKRSVKILKVLFVAIIAFTLTGCVKFNATMEISKSGKINYNILYAINKSLLNGESLLTDEDKKNLEEQGFKVEDYADDDMEGVNLTLNNLDINKVSSTDKNILYDLSGLTDEDKDAKIFYVEKGLFKNKYTAKIKFDTNDSDISDTDDDATDGDYSYREDEYTDVDSDYDDYDYYDSDLDDSYDDDYDSDDDGSFSSDDFSQYMSNMEMKFVVKLPYKAISNNATSVDNDGKNLTWDLTKTSDLENLEFEFALYNTTNIIIFVVLGVVVIGGVIFLVINKKNKGKKETSPVNQENVNDTVNNTNENINTFPVENNNVVAAASSDDNNKEVVNNEVSLRNIPEAKIDTNNNSTIGSN